MYIAVVNDILPLQALQKSLLIFLVLLALVAYVIGNNALFRIIADNFSVIVVNHEEHYVQYDKTAQLYIENGINNSSFYVNILKVKHVVPKVQQRYPFKQKAQAHKDLVVMYSLVNPISLILGVSELKSEFVDLSHVLSVNFLLV